MACIMSCSNDPSPINYTPTEDLYKRNDADKTLIPLVEGYRWNYRVNKGDQEKPTGPIRNILDNDVITSARLLPVREYDNNEGWGRYEYQALCYITSNYKVFFYMGDFIYIGRYLQTDNNGFESVMWDYQLPIYSTQNSSRYFVLNRNVSSPKQEEDYLHEKSGYYTIEIEVGAPDWKKYTECKLFEYHNKRNNVADPIRINRFYFKHGKGLIRYQQFIQSPTDSTTMILYEQDLLEGF
jgi:hypothetical protein